MFSRTTELTKSFLQAIKQQDNEAQATINQTNKSIRFSICLETSQNREHPTDFNKASFRSGVVT